MKASFINDENRCVECEATALVPENVSYLSRLVTSSSKIGEHCHSCNRMLCTKCCKTYPLVVPPRDSNRDAMIGIGEDIYEKIEEPVYAEAVHSSSSSSSSSSTSPYASGSCGYKCHSASSSTILTKHNIKPFCQACFKTRSTINFSSGPLDVIGPVNGAPVVFAHGAGGSKQSLRAHAEYLVRAKGYRCYLFDFPGFGTLENEECNLEACVQTACDVAQKAIDSDPQHRRPLYVGVSFGGYVGFAILGMHPELFSSAVIVGCGQNIGPGRGRGAACVMAAMEMISGCAGNRDMMQLFMEAAKGGKLDEQTALKSIFQAGVFFKQSQGMIHTLSSIAPGNYIHRFTGPILFANGSKEARDSEEKWLGLCQIRDRSRLKVFEDGEYFFTCESRFMAEFCQDVIQFYEAELSRQGISKSEKPESARVVTAF